MMKRKVFTLRTAVGIALLALLTACGGSSSDPIVATGTTGTTLTAVDPYIVGAVFRELDSAGEPVQDSTPSDENGQAVFTDAVQSGNSIVMISSGQHSGAQFKGTLKRKVEVAAENMVISPLTTLAAELGSTAAAVTVLTDAGLVVSAADIDADPMLALAGKTAASLGQTDLVQLVANLAVNAALNMVGASNSSDLTTIVQKVAAKLQVDADNDGTPDILNALQAVSGAGVDDAVGSLAGLTDTMIDQVETAKNAGTITDNAQVASQVETMTLPPASEVVTTAAAGNGTVAITDGGTVTAPVVTVREMLVEGFAALDRFETSATAPVAELMTAVSKFKSAKGLIASDTAASQAEKDQARFFGAFAELLVLTKPYSDLTENGLNNLGDILDAFGIEKGAVRGDFDTLPVEDCTTGDCDWVALPADSPTSGELQQAVGAMLLSRLQLVVDDMSKVSAAFKLSRSEPGLNASGETEYDYADALMVKGIAQAMRAQISLLSAYDLDIDLDAQQSSQSTTVEAFLADNPDLGELATAYATRLASAKADFSAAADSITAAIDALVAETATDSDQTDDLISFYTESCNWDSSQQTMVCTEDTAAMAADIADAKAGLAEIKAGLNGPVTFDEGTADAVTVDFSQLFAGISLRGQMPTFVGDVPGQFPDATLGGVLVTPSQVDINQDLDADGSPDLLIGYTKFFPGLLDGSADGNSGRTFNSYLNDMNMSKNIELQFDTQNETFTLNWTDYSQYPSSMGTETGSYDIIDGTLKLTNDNNASPFFVTLDAVLDSPAEGGWDLEVLMTGRDSSGAESFSLLTWWW